MHSLLRLSSCMLLSFIYIMLNESFDNSSGTLKFTHNFANDSARWAAVHIKWMLTFHRAIVNDSIPELFFIMFLNFTIFYNFSSCIIMYESNPFPLWAYMYTSCFLLTNTLFFNTFYYSVLLSIWEIISYIASYP